MNKEKVIEAAKNLLSFQLEAKVDKKRFPEFFGLGYEEGDENFPFFTEASLYGLFGKEDARSILGLLHWLLKACDIDMDELQEQVWNESQKG